MKALTVTMIIVLAICSTSLQGSEVMHAMDFRAVKAGGEMLRRRNLQIEHLFRYQTKHEDGKEYLNFETDVLGLFVNRISLAEADKNIICSGYLALGKFLDAAVHYAAATGDQKLIAQKDRIVKTILASQDDDGYFGIIRKTGNSDLLFKAWILHEGAYLCTALLDDYRYFGNKQSLGAAERFFKMVMANWHRSPKRAGDCSPIGIDETGLLLYQVTGKKEYLEFTANTAFDGRYIEMESLRDWDQILTPIKKVKWTTLQERMAYKVHTYRYFARCYNQLTLYGIEHDDSLLKMTRHTLGKLYDSQKPGLFISGAVGRREGWVDDQYGEGSVGEFCAIAYMTWWLGSLIEVDGNLRHGDIIETAMLNHVYAAQHSQDGRERYFVCISGKRNYRKGAHCCQGNFHRYLSRITGYVYYTFDDGVAVNLYTPGECRFEMDGVDIRLEQRTDYPVSGAIEVIVDPAEERDFALRLRIPEWAKEFDITVNRKAVVPIRADGGVEIRRKWKKGDVVKLQLPMEWRWVKGVAANRGYHALMRGPQVMTLSGRLNPDLKNHTWRDIIIDQGSLSVPCQKDKRVKNRNGFMCNAKGWSPESDRSKEPDLKLVFTDFAEESSLETYFRLTDSIIKTKTKASIENTSVTPTMADEQL